MANGDIVTVSQTRGLLCQHWGSSGYMMVSTNTSQGLAGFKAFWWWCRELKVTGYISRHRRQWRTLHLMFIIYDHSILRILRMSSWVTKWRWHVMFYFWEGEILSGFWSWTWWIRARIKMMRRVTGGGMQDVDRLWLWSQYSGWIFPNIGVAPPLRSWHQSILLVSLVTRASNKHSQSLKLYNHGETSPI